MRAPSAAATPPTTTNSTSCRTSTRMNSTSCITSRGADPLREVHVALQHAEAFERRELLDRLADGSPRAFLRAVGRVRAIDAGLRPGVMHLSG